MFFSKRVIKRGALYLTALTIALVLLSPYFIEPLINSKTLKSKLSAEIRKKTGVLVEPEGIEFMLFPNPGICFLNFQHEFNERIRLTIDRIEVDLDLINLFNRRVSVKKIQVEGPRLIYSPPGSTAPRLPALADRTPFQFKIPEDAVTELFALFPDSQDDLEIMVKQAKTDYFDTMDARFLVFKDNRSMVFKSTIKGINLSPGQLPGLDRLTRNSVQMIQVEEMAVNLRLDSTNTLYGNTSLTAPAVRLTRIPGKPLSAKSLNLDLSLSKEVISARLAPAEFIYPKAGIGVEFKNNHKAGHSAITFTGSKVDISQAREVCLPLLAGNDVVDSLFDILRAGTAEDITVGFQANSLANLFNGENLVLKGSATSARVKIPEVPLIAENVHGSAIVDKGILCVKAEKGKAAGASITGGDLDIHLLEDDEVPFKGRFTLKADLSTLPRTLISLLPETGLAKELVQVSKISGRADAVLSLNMPKGKKELDVRVWAKNINATSRYDRTPLPVQIREGSFSYEEDTVTLTNISGTLGKSLVQDIDARIDISDTLNLKIEKAKANLILDDLVPWMKSHPPVMALIHPARNLKGNLTLDQVVLNGPMFEPAQWQFSINGSGDEISIDFGRDRFSAQKISGRFKMNEQALNVADLQAEIIDISWLEGAVDPDYLSSIRMPLQVMQTSIKEQKGEDYLHGKILTPAGPLLSFDLTGSSISDLTPTLVALEDPGITDIMILSNTSPDKPRFSFEGSLNAVTLEKPLVPGSPLYEKLLTLTAGDPITVYTDTDSRLHVKTEHLNLDAFLARDDGTAEKENRKKQNSNRPLLSQKSLFLNAEKLIYLGKEITEVDSKISFSPDKTRIQVRHADFCDLTTRGYVDFYHGKESEEVVSEFDTKSLNREDISNVLGCLFDSDSIIEGHYTFEGVVKGRGTRDEILNSQNGAMFFKARSGRIYKATLLSRVLSVLNILGETDLRQQGFGYKTFTVDATIKESIIHLNKVYIDADNMAIIASGWADVLNDRLELTFLVAPFKTIDTIIQHIPLVNTILSGRLISFPAKASGKLSDPTVIPLHPSAVGKGLVNLFGDLIKAPVRLFEGDNSQ